MSREPSGAIFLPGTTSSPIQRSTSTPGVRFSTLNREGGGPSPGQSPFNKVSLECILLVCACTVQGGCTLYRTHNPPSSAIRNGAM